MLKITRNSLTLFAVALTVCAAVLFAKAQEKASGDHKMMSHGSMKMLPEEMKMAGEHMDKLKMKASEHPAEMAADMARMMVMDKMAMHMATDPSFLHMLDQTMSDPNMREVHDEARKMAQDPAQVAKITQQIADDPMAMGMVMHLARTMAMMHGGMMHDGKMGHSMMKDNNVRDVPAREK